MVHNGAGLWSKVLWFPPGMHEYKFTVNGWSGPADSMTPGDFCTLSTYGQGVTYVNRAVGVQGEPVSLPAVCMSSCLTCAGTLPVQMQPVTFRMHHSEIAGGAAEVVVPGVGAFAMEAGLSGVYQTTQTVPVGAPYAYRMNGTLEQLPVGCAPRAVPGNGTFAPYPDCFAECGTCGTCNDPGNMDYSAFGTFSEGCAGGPWVPGCTVPTAANYAPVATWDDGSCVAGAPNPCPADWDGSSTVNVADLLILLAGFGNQCVD